MDSSTGKTETHIILSSKKHIKVVSELENISLSLLVIHVKLVQNYKLKANGPFWTFSEKLALQIGRLKDP